MATLNGCWTADGAVLRGALGLALLTLASAPDGARAAPAPESGLPLGNAIVVTAEKRETLLRELPASASLVSAEQIDRVHARDLMDLQALVPSLKIRQFQNSGQANFQIRGFGNDANNIGIETAVGVFVDGVYYSRAASALADLPDIERIEVLRGPQSSLFGKNVSAGAISIVTKRPQLGLTSLEAEVTLGNYAAFEARATANLPLAPTLAIRLAGSLRERDGYFRSTVAGGRVNDRNRYGLRADVAFEPYAGLRFRFLVDHGRIAETCCGVVALAAGPVTTGIIAGRLGAPVGDPARIYDYRLAIDENPANRLVNDGASLQGEIDLGFADLTTITAWRRQSNDYSLDADFTGASIVRQSFATRIETASQELRLTSRGDGPFQWLVGGFVLDERLRSNGASRWGRDGRGFLDGLTANGVTTLERVLMAVRSPGIAAGSFIAAGQGLAENYRMRDRSYSLFAHGEYRWQGLRLSGGFAYVNDRKDAAQSNVSNDLFAQLNLTNLPQLALAGLAPGSFRGLSAVQFFPAAVNFPSALESGVLRGERVTYTLRLAYDLSEAITVYINRSTGWKAGAFNLSRDSRPPDAAGFGRTAGPETISLYEAGLRASAARGYLNLAAFIQAVDGFQSNSFTGTGFALVNAGRQSVRGLELEAGYRPVEGLSLDAALTYLDPRFDAFARAPCVPADPIRCGSGQLTRDLSGMRPADSPAWTVSLGTDYAFVLGRSWTGRLHADFFFTSTTFQALTVPADLARTRARTLNLSASLGRSDLAELTLWARNVTNDRYTRNAFPAVAQPGSYAAFPAEPRLFGATLRRRF